MSGQSLMVFLASILGLCGVYAIFYTAVASPYLAMDATLQKIGRIAMGVVVGIAVILAFSALFFGGAGGMVGVSSVGVIHFAIGMIILMVALAVAVWLLGFFFPDLQGNNKNLVMFIIGAIALIVILLIAVDALFGGLGWGLNRPLPLFRS